MTIKMPKVSHAKTQKRFSLFPREVNTLNFENTIILFSREISPFYPFADKVENRFFLISGTYRTFCKVNLFLAIYFCPYFDRTLSKGWNWVAISCPNYYLGIVCRSQTIINIPILLTYRTAPHWTLESLVCQVSVVFHQLFISHTMSNTVLCGVFQVENCMSWHFCQICFPS